MFWRRCEAVSRFPMPVAYASCSTYVDVTHEGVPGPLTGHESLEAPPLPDPHSCRALEVEPLPGPDIERLVPGVEVADCGGAVVLGGVRCLFAPRGVGLAGRSGLRRRS